MTISFDGFDLDIARRRLTKHGRRVRIQPQPLSVLIALASRPGETVTRAELHATLWPDGTHVEFDAALNTAVRKLRRVLGDEAARARYILTIPGVGYRFVGEIEIRPAAPLPSQRIETLPTVPVPLHSSAVSRRVQRLQVAALLVLSLLAGLVVPSRAAHNSSALSTLLAGVRALTANDIIAAQAHFEEAAARDPQSSHAWAGLAYADARIAFSEGDRTNERFARARAAAHRALALDADVWTAHAALAYVAVGQDQDHAAAEKFMANAVERGTNDPRLFIDYACLLKSARRVHDALAVVERGLRRSPGSAVLHAHRGLHLHAVGRYAEELPELLLAVARDPAAAEAHFHLGLGYARRQQWPAALTALQTAVALSDGNPLFLSWLGRIAADAGRARDAEQVLHTLQQRAVTGRVPAALIDAVAHHLAAARS